MENISKHITYNESCFSQTAVAKGIDNRPNVEQLANMKLVAENCFEPLRENFGVPIRVNSFFRSKALNKAIRGVSTSEHCTGNAIDISSTTKGLTNKEIGEWIMNNLPFNQLIYEDLQTDGSYRWIHVSYKKSGNKFQVLEMKKINGKSKYFPYK